MLPGASPPCVACSSHDRPLLLQRPVASKRPSPPGLPNGDARCRLANGPRRLMPNCRVQEAAQPTHTRPKASPQHPWKFGCRCLDPLPAGLKGGSWPPRFIHGRTGARSSRWLGTSRAPQTAASPRRRSGPPAAPPATPAPQRPCRVAGSTWSARALGLRAQRRCIAPPVDWCTVNTARSDHNAIQPQSPKQLPRSKRFDSVKP